MSCFVCGGPVPEYGFIVLNTDGDIACCQTCKEDYEKNREIFFNKLIHDRSTEPTEVS